MNNSLTDFHQLLICWSLMEPFLHRWLVKFLKTFHTRTMGHHYNTLHNLLLVLSDKLKSEKEKKFKMLENVWFKAFHKFHVIRSKFKRSLLKAHVSRGRWNDERVINVNDMSMSVNENVVIMSVFDAKQILDETVSSETLYEICYSSLPIKSKDLFINVLKRLLAWFFLQVTHSSSIINELNKTTVIIVGDDIVRSDPKFKIFFDGDFMD